MDPRFSESDHHNTAYSQPWNEVLESCFRAGLENVRKGLWPNYWSRLGGVYVPFMRRPDVADEIQFNWMREMDAWDSMFKTVNKEIAAYRALRALQGSDIPLMYGACQFTAYHAGPSSDPVVTSVPGICIQYIDGVSMDRLNLGVDLSQEDAERVAQGVLRIARNIRQCRVIHNDMAGRNVIVRLEDLDHPVVIDFGSSFVCAHNDDGTSIVAGFNELKLVRRFLDKMEWHTHSPRADEIRNHPPNTYTGYSELNAYLGRMLPACRARNFVEDVERPSDLIKVDEQGKQHVWEYPRWRLESDKTSTDADNDWMG